MSVKGTIAVTCPACGQASTCELVQSINARTGPTAKARLIAGALNVLQCPCGRRTALGATVLFHDPDASYYCQVVTGGEPAMASATALMLGVGAVGTQRLVPSQNALVEKVKLLDAGLDDGAVEVAKVLLLASLDPNDLDRVMLFDRLDGDTIHWVLFDGAAPATAASSRAQYDKLASSPSVRPGPRELRIDRAWAVMALQALMAAGN